VRPFLDFPDIGLDAGDGLLGRRLPRSATPPAAASKAAPPVPEQAVADIKADVEEIKERTHR
jgi:hypothetical protein